MKIMWIFDLLVSVGPSWSQISGLNPSCGMLEHQFVRHHIISGSYIFERNDEVLASDLEKNLCLGDPVSQNVTKCNVWEIKKYGACYDYCWEYRWINFWYFVRSYCLIEVSLEFHNYDFIRYISRTLNFDILWIVFILAMA